MIGIIATVVVAFSVGGIFGFLICAIIVASEDEKNGKK